LRAISQAGYSFLTFHRFADCLAIPLRQRQVDKVVHPAAKTVVLADFDAKGIRFDEMVSIDRADVSVAGGAEGGGGPTGVVNSPRRFRFSRLINYLNSDIITALFFLVRRVPCFLHSGGELSSRKL
jgi:hypothetical protein